MPFVSLPLGSPMPTASLSSCPGPSCSLCLQFPPTFIAREPSLQSRTRSYLLNPPVLPDALGYTHLWPPKTLVTRALLKYSPLPLPLHLALLTFSLSPLRLFFPPPPPGFPIGSTVCPVLLSCPVSFSTRWRVFLGGGSLDSSQVPGAGPPGRASVVITGF